MKSIKLWLKNKFICCNKKNTIQSENVHVIGDEIYIIQYNDLCCYCQKHISLSNTNSISPSLSKSNHQKNK